MTELPDPESCRRLVAAMLLYAARDYLAGQREPLQYTDQELEKLPKRRRWAVRQLLDQSTAACHWFFDDTTKPLGFLWSCSILDLPSERIRGQLRERPQAIRRQLLALANGERFI